MKIYFTAALHDIPSGQQRNYELIVKSLKNLGHRVVAGHIIGKTGKQLDMQTEKEQKEIYSRMLTWKNQADLMVAETSYPSFGVGQEISYSLTSLKPVIALHLKGRRPHLLTAMGTEYLHIAEYSKDTVKRVLQEYIEFAKDAADTRFNFFISPQIEAFLKWVSKKRKVPRAVFLRQLVEEDMRRNKSYSKNQDKEDTYNL